MKQIVHLNGTANHNIENYFLDRDTGLIFCIINHTCIADAQELICKYLNIERDGMALMRLKEISPEVKAHKKYFNTVKTTY